MTILPRPAALGRRSVLRASRLLVSWDAQDLLVNARSGQVGTFTRTQSVVNDGGRLPDVNGVLQTSMAGLPRFGMFDTDGDGVRDTAALVVEPNHTNLFVRSQELDNASWIKANDGPGTSVTISANARRAPDGTLTADDIVEAAVNSSHYIYQSVTITASAYVTLSAFVKQRSSTDRFRGILDIYYGSGQQAGISFRLDTLALSNVVAGSGIVTDKGIEAYADGWYRVWCTVRGDATTGVAPRLFILDDSGTQGYLGVTSKGLAAWGMQIETSATGATIGSRLTSYLPTTTATVQRPTEALEFGDAYQATFVPDSLTVYAKFIRPSWYASTGSLDEYAYLLWGEGNPRFGIFCARDARTIIAQLTDSVPTFTSATETMPTTRVIEACAQMRNIRSQGQIRLDVGSGFGAYGATTLIPVAVWGGTPPLKLPIGGADPTATPYYNLGTGLLALKIARGEYTLEDMRGFQ